MERASIDGRRNTTPKAAGSSMKQSRKKQITPKKPQNKENDVFRPASPPKYSPWNPVSGLKPKPASDKFPPLPPPHTFPASTKTSLSNEPTAHTSPTSSISSFKDKSREEASPVALTATPVSVSSNPSTTSRLILEAAASRATANLWARPFGADVVVHAGNMAFRVHRDIVIPESGWFRDKLSSPHAQGLPAHVYMPCAPEAVGHCLRFIYTQRFEICEYNREQPWNVLHLPRCVLGYHAAIYLRIPRLASHLLRIVEDTAMELGNLVKAQYLDRFLSYTEWVQFQWHYQSALEIIYHDRHSRLMSPIRLAIAGVLDALLFWLIRQPAFLELLQTTWRRLLRSTVLDIAEYRDLITSLNPHAIRSVSTEAELRQLFEETERSTQRFELRIRGTPGPFPTSRARTTFWNESILPQRPRGDSI